MSNPVTRFFASRAFARGLGSVGRLMITSGSVILLLVAYQLWGTNLQTNKAQNSLANEYESIVDSPSDGTTPTPAPTTTQVPPLYGTTTLPVPSPAGVAPAIAAPANGQTFGRISIPSIGLRDFYFIEGVGVDQLKKGAGHYPGTPLPGQQGNSAIAGHRTTYGAPFHNIDKVRSGDMVTVETIQGKFTYEVTGQEIVSPTEVSVLDPTPGPTLTLTACHPKFSARERIITFAKLVGTPVAKLANQDEQAKETIAASKNQDGADRNAIDAFESEPVVTFPGAWWGLACMILWLSIRLLAWEGHRTRRYPRWIPYLVGSPVCLIMLYFFFEAFSYEGFTRALNLNL